MGKRADHLHKFKKVNLGTTKRYNVFRCQELHCSYYIRVDLALGQLVKCNRCGDSMVMTKFALTLAKPHCVKCTRARPNKEAEVIDAFADMFKEDENA